VSGRVYDVVHHDGLDQRGIDVVFIYDTARFTAVEQFCHVVKRRTAPRVMFVTFAAPAKA
jgi:hypothetical protein